MLASVLDGIRHVDEQATATSSKVGMVNFAYLQNDKILYYCVLELTKHITYHGFSVETALLPSPRTVNTSVHSLCLTPDLASQLDKVGFLDINE